MRELRAAGCAAEHLDVPSPWGHDSFLLDVPEGGGDVVAGGIQDGATVEIRHGTDSVVFEFDKNGQVTPGNRRVAISSNSSRRRICSDSVDWSTSVKFASVA